MNLFYRVTNNYLHLVSGVLWSAIGLLLITFATSWLISLHLDHPWFLMFSGTLAGIIVAFYGFTGIVNQNIQRINELESPVSVFAFQSWKSYLLALLMMAMGLYIRRSDWIPLFIKTPGYYTIGTALSISSFRYYRAFSRAQKA
jgi:hypothetical protein